MDQLLTLLSTQYPALLAILTVVTTVFTSGVVTAVLTQVMKLKFIPVATKKYPRVTSVLVALVVSALSVWLLGVAVVVDWATFLIFVAVTVVLSWKIYDNVWKVLNEVIPPTK